MLLFYLAPLYNIHCFEWGVFILLPLGALRGLVEFCADRASQRRTLLCDLFVCILWLHAVWYFAATVFARPKAVTAAARSVAARVRGNDCSCWKRRDLNRCRTGLAATPKRCGIMQRAVQGFYEVAVRYYPFGAGDTQAEESGGIDLPP